MGVHPTAIVDAGAKLADDVSVGPYAVIGPDVVIGAKTVVGSHTVIFGPTTIGSGNRLFQFSSIGDAPQDKKYAGEPTELRIGDNNTIREFCTINRGTAQDAGVTSIGDDNWIMSYVHIAHDCQLGSHIIMANNTTLAGHVHIGDWVILGGFSGVHQFCRVGAHAFVGMYGAVGRDVPAYVMVAGTPTAARGINSEGLKRREFTKEQIKNIKSAYKLVYRSGQKLTDACAELEGRVAEQPELAPFIETIQKSERGLMR